MNMEAYQEFMKIKEFTKKSLDSSYNPEPINKKAMQQLRDKYKEIGIEDDERIFNMEHRKSRQQHREIELYLQTAQIYEISDKHKFLLMLTKNPKSDDEELWDNVRLPFPEIFIDVVFLQDEFDGNDNRITGLLIKEMKQIETMKDDNGDMKPVIIYGLEAFVCGITKDRVPFFDKFRFPIKTKFADDQIKLETKYMDKNLAKFIKKFIINFILFLKDREVTYIDFRRSRKGREKRIKQGRIPLPDSRVIRLTGELKRYVNSLDDSDFKGKLSHKFWVSGHYRIYKSQRYKNMRGKVQWIEPFKKGQGVEVRKVRRIEPDDDEETIHYEDIKPLKKPLREQRDKK